MKREELKPCPFCGAEAERIFIGNDFTKTRKVEIECTGCHTKMVVGAIRNTHEWCDETVTKKWNNRQQPLPPAEGAEEILAQKTCCTIDDEADLDDPKNFYYKYEDVIAAMRTFAAQQQPTAEGAEEIFRECFAEEAVKRGDVPLSDEKWNDLVKESGGFMFRAMKRFATLHAQRIAEKMVEERLKEEGK